MGTITALPVETEESALTGAQGVAAIQKAHDMPSAASVNAAVSTNVSEHLPPNGFAAHTALTGIKVYRNGDYWDCNIKPHDLIDFSVFTNTLYVDSENGNDSNDGSTWALAKATVNGAFDGANASTEPTRIKILAGRYKFLSGLHPSNATETMTVPMTLESVYGSVELTTQYDVTYSQNATYSNVYEAGRSAAQQMFNFDSRDSKGEPLRYQHVTSLALCAALAGTWYTDDVSVYVHTHTGVPANNNNAAVLLAGRTLDINTGNNNLYLYGINTFGGNTGGLSQQGGTDNVIVVDNCTFKYAMYGKQGIIDNIEPRDGVSILGCGIAAFYDSESSYGSKDGFNYHEDAAVDPFGLLVRCKAYDNGYLIRDSTSNNGVTLHDGIGAIDVGGEWLGSIGTNSGHVNNNTQYWGVGVKSGNSEGDIFNGGSVTWGAFGIWSGNGKMWLDSCTDVGSTIGVYAADGAIAYLRNHNGTGSLTGGIESY